MKIAIMMRPIDQEDGLGVYTECLIEAMLQIDRRNSYLLLYRSPKKLGRFSSYKNAKEVLLKASHKLLWDQVAVPYMAWRERAAIIFNPKFSVPIVSSCPVVMGLQEPAWWAWREYYEWWDALYMRLALPLYCRKSARLLSWSYFNLGESLKYFNLPIGKVTVIYPAPKKIFFPRENTPSLKKFREKYGLPKQFILGVTRVDHHGNDKPTFYRGKNIETTIRAFSICRKDIPHELVIAGRNVREYLSHIGWRKSDLEGVHPIGFIPHEELPLLYNLADLFVIPSFYEGFGFPLVEAMASGCPVVASQTGSCPEISGKAALLADPHNPADFAEKIALVLNDEQLRQELRAKSLARASFFQWTQTARLTLETLTQVALAAETLPTIPIGKRD